MQKVAVIMGSKSDLEIVQKAFGILEEFEIPFEAHIFSAHRTPEALKAFAVQARDQGFGVLIAAAGKAAHLAGVIASLSTLPTIAIPMRGNDLQGLDSLLSSVQMPAGIPVACVGINAAENAALLAIEILALNSPKLQDKLAQKRQQQAMQILKEDQNIHLEYSRNS
ncbi:5-(carboxyamino)imidazole ribonucleotide mutase [Helicobacter felis]|uniref:N5-carboxyaminoimidazole ribonucleotide mutase n=1 Tax=Helicobacter felis (strain ATCC 49179 / CCUG 28539 / NCTC 12436 / CS1) TaxID=936155 RepID=E7AAQ5_HELFC|nr:5-(carboxyamino)imidazole ribonucleotide mutase [Helicobacter felis]CBY82726.1 phosphoribosylaminoimidazole carboxylase catalytic subunit [Helicobacter felis ATCC 49179]